uniref:Uncharacterized protein n=1 Tax=Panagrolaimus davidi TaxID=227884 RepID=A0A914PJ02_9BILA
MTSFIAKVFAIACILAIICQIQAQTTCSADGDCFQQCPNGQYAGCWFFGEIGGGSTCHCFYSNDFGI